MSIRQKLFIFIPLLVLLMSFVSYFLFESSRSSQASYQLFMDRILLYKQVSQESKEVTRYLNRYVLQVSAESYPDLEEHLNTIRRLQDQLNQVEQSEKNALSVQNYIHLVSTFLEKSWAIENGPVIQGSNTKASAYLEVEQLSRFIGEDGQALVDLELEGYRPIYEKLMKATASMNILGIVLVITVALLSIVFSLWLSSSISHPIRLLVLTAKQISKGNLEKKAPNLGLNDEIGILCRTFNQMIDNIHELMEKHVESVKKEGMVKEMELKMLQSQINPHFLFNTLNVLAKLAYIEGAEKTSDLTVSVSRLLRYNLQKLDHPVTLRDEVHNAMEYMAIQRERFGDRILFIVDIDEASLNLLIPCLTLQPLLENAIVHGIEHMEEGGVLRLSIKTQGERVLIEIADNGEGMNEETRVKLMLSVWDDLPRPRNGLSRSTGLGTVNVFKRLHIFYDAQQSIEIISDIGKGTIIKINLPYHSKFNFDPSEGSKHV